MGVVVGGVVRSMVGGIGGALVGFGGTVVGVDFGGAPFGFMMFRMSPDR